MPKTSRYSLIVDNISSTTPVRDIEREFAYFGKIRDCVKDGKHRLCLVEFERSVDAQVAWRKMVNVRMDGRQWKVDWATREDFRFFGWKWFEYSPSPVRRSRSRGRSPSRSPSRSRSASRSPARRSRSRSPNTPHAKDDRRGASKSTSPPARREDGGRQQRSPSPGHRED